VPKVAETNEKYLSGSNESSANAKPHSFRENSALFKESEKMIDIPFDN
jgi:hypothetical protein